jgi:catechol 2,3-dioxygenase-like lactoylglutathione lyase family enzyme
MKRRRRTEATYPITFHIGFFVESAETVDATHRRLQADGFAVADPERHHAYGFYVAPPGGFTVELGS